MSYIRPFATGDLQALYQLFLEVEQLETAAALGPYAMAVESFSDFEAEMQSRDYPPEKRFVLCFEDSKLKAAMGFDRDRDAEIADIEGPYSLQGECKIDDLFSRLAEMMRREGGLTDLRIIVYPTAPRSMEFAERYGFQEFRERSFSMDLHRRDLREVRKPDDFELAVGSDERFWESVCDLLSQGLSSLCRSPEELNNRLSDPAYSLRIVSRGSELVGLALFRGHQDRQHLLYFTMTSAYRGKNLSKPTLNIILDSVFDSQPTVTITLSVSKKNDAAIRLYESIGFNVRSEIRHTKRKLIPI